MEIVNDLIGVQTVLSVGKTAKLYNVVGDIADDVSVSIDGGRRSPSTTLTTRATVTRFRCSLLATVLTGVMLLALTL